MGERLMAYNPASYQHWHKRLMRLVERYNTLASENHKRKQETGYYKDWRNVAPDIRAREATMDRLQPLINRCDHKRDSFASTERWSPYRAWPH
jgi:hypothetical protein